MNKVQLNSNHLKLIAIIAMTIDHIADLCYPGFTGEPIPIAMHSGDSLDLDRISLRLV